MDVQNGPTFSSERSGDAVAVLVLPGIGPLDASAELEAEANALLAEGDGARQAILDLGAVDRLDSAGAWLIDRTRQDLGAKGVDAKLESIRPEFGLMLREAHYRAFDAPKRPRGSYFVALCADIGESVVIAGRDLVTAVDFSAKSSLRLEKA